MTSNHKGQKAKDRKKRAPQPVRMALDNLSGIITEAGKVYRLARAGQLPTDKAAKLVWMLGQLRAMVETQALERLEAKLDALSEAAARHNGTHPARALPHINGSVN